MTVFVPRRTEERISDAIIQGQTGIDPPFVLCVGFEVLLAEVSLKVKFLLRKGCVVTEKKVSKALLNTLIAGTSDTSTCRVDAKRALGRTGCDRIIERCK